MSDGVGSCDLAGIGNGYIQFEPEPGNWPDRQRRASSNLAIAGDTHGSAVLFNCQSQE